MMNRVSSLSLVFMVAAAVAFFRRPPETFVPEPPERSKPVSEALFTFIYDYYVLSIRNRPRAVHGLELSASLFRKAHKRRLRSPEFLQAIDELMPSFEALGTAIHAAAVKDVLGNTRKLRRHGAPRVPVQTLARRDFENCDEDGPDSAAQALLWLARILKFTSAFFQNLVDRDSSLTSCLLDAYDHHLGPHHNLVMRQLASVLIHIIPDRESMVSCFDLAKFDDLKPYLKRWIAAANPVIDKLFAFYVDFAKDFHDDRQCPLRSVNTFGSVTTDPFAFLSN